MIDVHRTVPTVLENAVVEQLYKIFCMHATKGIPSCQTVFDSEVSLILSTVHADTVFLLRLS